MTFFSEIRDLRPAGGPASPVAAAPGFARGARRIRPATPVRRWALAALAAVATAALAACDPYVQGNGVYQEEDRSAALAPFVGIDVEDGIRVIATETSASGLPVQTVVVSADANVVRWLKTEVREETIGGVATAVLYLLVDAREFVSENQPTAIVRAAGLRYLRARDGARVEARFAEAPHFVVDAASGADVTLQGAGGVNLDANLSAGFVHATAYPVEFAQVALAGGSRLELRAALAAGTADAASRIENVAGVCEVSGTTQLFCCAAPGCP